MVKAGARLPRIDAFRLANGVLMALVVVLTLYPFLFIISSSVSDPLAVSQNRVVLLPKGFTLGNYRIVFSNNNVLLSYWNTIRYTVVGTLINVVLTVCMAYPLSRRRFPGRRGFMKLITFTMLFSGGLIPGYLLVKYLGLMDTLWAVVLPGAVSTWNLIVTRTFFDLLPESLEEAARIDGSNDIQIFTLVFLPLSAPILATITLFYAVGHWSDFFGPLLFLNSKGKFPLMIFLRNMLISGEMTDYASQQTGEVTVVAQSIKYTVIVVTTLPIVLIYPFLQRHFVKGVMIGAIKG